MAFIPTLQTVRVDALQDLDGQHCENTLWYYSAGGTLDTVDMAGLGAAVNSVFTTSMVAFHSDSWTYRGCVVTDQTSESAPAVNVPVTPAAGTDASVSAPNNVSFVIKFLTSGRGRSSRGRNYVVGIPNAQIGGNQVDSFYVAGLVSAYEQLLIPSLDIDASLVVVSHYVDLAPRAAGLAQPVTAISFTDYVVDSQRRRLPGRGN
jgi:hypothetical protein